MTGSARAFVEMVSHSMNAWRANAKLLAFFGIPFLIVLPLAALMPNFVSLGGIFLRFGSVQTDLTLLNVAALVIEFAASLALFSFALAAVNVATRSQRTLRRLTHHDINLIENATLKLFTIFLMVFVLTLLVNLLLYDVRVGGAPLHTTLGAFFAFLFAAIALYAPQAVVIDELPIDKAIAASFRVLLGRAHFTIAFIIFAAVLLAANTGIFLAADQAFSGARYLSLATMGLLILPFLEVLKTQVYLSKYTLLIKL